MRRYLANLLVPFGPGGWRGVPAKAIIEQSVFKMLIGTSLDVWSENFCSDLYWLGAVVTNLRHYLVEDVIYLRLYWSSSIKLDNQDQDENPYLGHF